jgi:metal-responsive CopG/Arc/MetJ family transcriptional regulator
MTMPTSTRGDCGGRRRRLYSGMKTAISLPDQLFRAGDALAKRLKVSRSELYARALGEYLAKHRPDQVTQRLNAVYATEDSALDPALGAVQSRTLPREDW